MRLKLLGAILEHESYLLYRTVPRKFPDLETDIFNLRNVGNKDIDFISRPFSNAEVCAFQLTIDL